MRVKWGLKGLMGWGLLAMALGRGVSLAQGDTVALLASASGEAPPFLAAWMERAARLALALQKDWRFLPSLQARPPHQAWTPEEALSLGRALNARYVLLLWGDVHRSEAGRVVLRVQASQWETSSGREWRRAVAEREWPASLEEGDARLQAGVEETVQEALTTLRGYPQVKAPLLASPQGDRVALGLGARQGIRPGAEFTLFRNGQPQARVQVDQVEPSSSQGRILWQKSGASLSQGDVLELTFNPPPSSAAPQRAKGQRFLRAFTTALAVAAGVLLVRSLTRHRPEGRAALLPSPEGLVFSPADRSITLAWKPVERVDVAGYVVYRSEFADRGFAPIGEVNAQTTSFADTGLINGKTYYYQVAAKDANGLEGERSAVIAATPAAAPPPRGIPPATPTGFTATAQDALVVLAWNANAETDLAGYFLYRSLFPDRGFVRIAQVPATATSHLDGNLINGVLYHYRLSAFDADGNESEPTQVVAARPLSSRPPAIPQGLQAVPGDGQVVLSWEPNSETDLLGYDVYRATVLNGNYEKITATPLAPGVTTYFDRGLENGTTYFYKLRAVNMGGLASPFTEAVSATPATTQVPNPPQNVAILPGDGRLTLRWEPPASNGAAEYRLYRAENVAGPYNLVATVAAPLTQYEDPGLQNGKTYYYRLSARNLAGLESRLTDPVAGTPVSATPPSPPQGLQVRAEFDRNILTWQANPELDLKEYVVYRSVGNINGPYELLSISGNPVPVPITFLVDTSVVAGVKYFYRIRAVNLGGLQSEFSAPAFGRPGQPSLQLFTPEDGQQIVAQPPEDPTRPNPQSIATFNLAWSAVANAERYIVEVSNDPNFTVLLTNPIVQAGPSPSLSLTLRRPFNAAGAEPIIVPVQHYWRVTAVDDNNVSIDQSEVRGFVILYPDRQ